MKVCPHCGDSYKDHVDFCFSDGEVLVVADAATASAALLESELDAPLPRRVQPVQQGQEGRDRTPPPSPVAGTGAVGPNGTPVQGDRGRPNEPVPSANLPHADRPQTDVAPELAVAVAAGGVQAVQVQTPATAQLPQVPPTEGIPVGPTVTPNVAPSQTPTMPPSPSAQTSHAASAATPLLTEPREAMRVAPLPTGDAVTMPMVRPPPRTRSTPASGNRLSPVPVQRVGGATAPMPPEPATDRSNLIMVGALVAFAAVLVPAAALAGVLYFVVVTGEWGELPKPKPDPNAIASVTAPEVQPDAAPAPSQPEGLDPSGRAASMDPGLVPDPDLTDPNLDGGSTDGTATDAGTDGVSDLGSPDPAVQPAPLPVPVDATDPNDSRPSILTVHFELLPESAQVKTVSVKNAIGNTERSMEANSRMDLRADWLYEFEVSADGYRTERVLWGRNASTTPTIQVTLRRQEAPVAPPKPVGKPINVFFGDTLNRPGGTLTINGETQVLPAFFTLPPGSYPCHLAFEGGSTDWTCVITGPRYTIEK